jgi:hypothetical protein
MLYLFHVPRKSCNNANVTTSVLSMKKKNELCQNKGSRERKSSLQLEKEFIMNENSWRDLEKHVVDKLLYNHESNIFRNPYFVLSVSAVLLIFKKK